MTKEKDEVTRWIAALKDTNCKVRRNAAKTLGKLGNRRAVAPLIQILKDPIPLVREAAVEALKQIRDIRAVEPFTQELFKSKRVQMSVAEALGVMVGSQEDPSPVLTQLLATLKSGTKEQRRRAVVALGTIGKHLEKPEAVSSALLEVLKDKDWQIRGTAWRALKELRDFPDELIACRKDHTLRVAALLIGLKDEEDPVHNYVDLAYMVGKLKDFSQVLPILLDALNDEEIRVHEAVAVALGNRAEEVEDLEPLVPVLHKLVEESDEGWVNYYIVQALAAIAPRLEDPSSIVPALQKAIFDHGDESWGVWWDVLYALAVIGPKVQDPSLVADALISGYNYAFDVNNEFRSPKIAEDAWYVLLNLEEPFLSLVVGKLEPIFSILVFPEWLEIENLETLIEKLEDPSPVVTLLLNLDDFDTIEWIFNEIGKPTATSLISPLLHALKSDDYEVQKAATIALGAIGEPALSPLIQTLKAYEEDDQTRASIIGVLHKLGWHPKTIMEKVPYYLQVIDYNWQQWPDETRKAIKMLTELGESAMEPLLKALGDAKNVGLRWPAAMVLGVICNERAITPLIQALQDENWMVRSHAAQALGAIGDAQAVDPLLQLLTDEDSTVRRAVVEALGRIGDVKAIIPLVQVLKEDLDVRRAAEGALEALGDERAVPHFI